MAKLQKGVYYAISTKTLLSLVYDVFMIVSLISLLMKCSGKF